MAPISSKGKNVYNRTNSFSDSKYKTFDENKPYNKVSGQVIVNSGDTLYNIARNTNIPIRDIIETNNLQPPYHLAAGTKLNLPNAKYHKVAAGETLYSISRNYSMNVDRLVEMNHLEKPYTIKSGDMLHIPDTEKNIVISTKTDNDKNAIVNSGNLEEKESETKSPFVPNFIFKNNNFIWPVKGQVISKFGAKAGGLYNDGINIRANRGDTVKAVEDGNVAYVGNELRGYGNLIIVKHFGGWISAYAHLDKTKVKRGDKISKGTGIATVGSTGNVDFPQLYFGIRKGREAVNPEIYLKN